MRWIRNIFIIAFLAWSTNGMAQQWSNYRIRTVPIGADTIRIDTLSVQSDFNVLYQNGDTLSPNSYILDALKSRLIWLNKPTVDSVQFHYRVLGFSFSKVYQEKSDTLINQTPTLLLNPFVVSNEDGDDEWLRTGGLHYNGSFARGLSFGNRQDVVLNSSFNLQLSGLLGNDVEVTAAMTDNNIPIQPEGNTQQLQDFDQVYIQLKRNETSLTVGDFEWRTPDGYFLRYNKKLQGASFSTRKIVNEEKSISATVRGSAAIARGQFGRNSFFGQEGNQGPYRLQGNNRESFIIILAGSERVYIDGQLLKRGAAQDYVIDYNTGEITFTPNRLITKDIRIIVEFEYSTQNYFRTLINAQHQWQVGKATYAINYYNEQDAKNQPILETLDSARIAQLSGVGDSIQNAFFTGFDSVGYATDQVRYKAIDTVVNGILYANILVYSSNPDSAIYRANFSFVGEGKGNYRIAPDNTINGRVYEWVAPVGGQQVGSYAPLVPLVAPQQRQMMTLRAAYQLSDETQLGIEWALSNRDFNTFSAIDDADDRGMGVFLNIAHLQPIRKDSVKPVSLAVTANYEYAGERFQLVENYRPMEFTRDWNTTGLAIRNDQHLLRSQIIVQGAKFGQIGYGLSGYQIPSQYQGLKHDVIANVRAGSWQFLSKSSYLMSTGTDLSTAYLRPTLELSRSISWLNGWRAGVGYMQEDNRIANVGTDSLLGSSFGFREWRFFTQSPDTAGIPVELRYVARIDRLPVLGQLPINNRGNTLYLTGGVLTNPKQQLRWTVTFRQLRYADTATANGTDEQTMLGRLQYNATFLKGLVRSSTLYEIGTGQEPQREFTFVRVPDGQGTYIWNDDGDGVQELAEFEIASENDIIFANYIRIFTPTRAFVRTNIAQLNQVLEWRPAALFTGEKKPFIAKWNNITTLNLNRKVIADGQRLQVNPFALDVADTALIAVSSLIRNALFYNRFGADLSGEFTLQDNRNKQLLTNGPESRSLRYAEVLLRWVFNQNISAKIRSREGVQGNTSAALASRNFRFAFTEIEPEVSYQYQAKFRLASRYLFARKQNEAELGAEEAIIHQLTLDARYNVVAKNNINTRFSFASVAYSGTVNNSLSYAMLAGLRDGRNLLWNITWERRLANNIQISLTYDGRKTGDNAIVHLGQAQLRAIF